MSHPPTSTHATRRPTSALIRRASSARRPANSPSGYVGRRLVALGRAPGPAVSSPSSVAATSAASGWSRPVYRAASASTVRAAIAPSRPPSLNSSRLVERQGRLVAGQRPGDVGPDRQAAERRCRGPSTSSTRSSQPSAVPVDEPPRSRQSWAWKWLRDTSGVDTAGTAVNWPRPHSSCSGASAGCRPKPRSSGSSAAGGTAIRGRAASRCGSAAGTTHRQPVDAAAQEDHDQGAGPRLAERGAGRHELGAERGGTRDADPGEEAPSGEPAAPGVPAAAGPRRPGRRGPAAAVRPCRAPGGTTSGQSAVPVVVGGLDRSRPCSSSQGEVGRVEDERDGAGARSSSSRTEAAGSPPRNATSASRCGGLERLEAQPGAQAVDVLADGPVGRPAASATGSGRDSPSCQSQTSMRWMFQQPTSAAGRSPGGVDVGVAVGRRPGERPVARLVGPRCRGRRRCGGRRPRGTSRGCGRWPRCSRRDAASSARPTAQNSAERNSTSSTGTIAVPSSR